jgi:hypothetical protein
MNNKFILDRKHIEKFMEKSTDYSEISRILLLMEEGKSCIVKDNNNNWHELVPIKNHFYSYPKDN